MAPKIAPPLNTAALLNRYALRPKKKLGQNFLEDPEILDQIVSIAGLKDSDTVLEIGPGLGSLTRHLALNAKNVVAVELDQGIIPVLRQTLSGYTNTEIVEGDILDITPKEIIQASDYLVIANIPYYITSAILRHLLTNQPRPSRMILTIQKEVAERICATEKRSLLALSVQVFGQPQIAGTIPAEAFYPPPNVDSAIIRIALYPQPRISAKNLDLFFKLAKAGFSQKRKTLRNSLTAGLHMNTSDIENLLTQAEINPQRRAETLSLDEWKKLTNARAKMR